MRRCGWGMRLHSCWTGDAESSEAYRSVGIGCDAAAESVLRLRSAWVGKPCPVTLRNFKHVSETTSSQPWRGGQQPGDGIGGVGAVGNHEARAGGGRDSVYAAMALARKIPVDTTQLPGLFPLALLLYFGVLTNILLFVFNLIPIPPLDGSRIIRYFLPYKWNRCMTGSAGTGSFWCFLSQDDSFCLCSTCHCSARSIRRLVSL